MAEAKPENEDEVRRVAVLMMGAGIATVSDAARLAGVSRQLAAYWARAAGINPPKVRQALLLREWKRRLRD